MNDIKPLTFFDMARASHVKRWGIINTVRPQTMAEHSFMVALITLELLHELSIKVDGPMEILNIVIGALVHDLPETRTGDIPTPGKALIDGAAGTNLLEQIEHALLPTVPYTGGLIPTFATHLIKLADLIADYHFLCDNSAGPYAFAIKDQLYERVLTKCRYCAQAMPDYQWQYVVDGIIRQLVDYTYHRGM
jgi:5'-deoxynucleotidase